VRRTHFEAFAPVCPACRTAGEPGAPLVLRDVFEEADGHILQGVLHCSNSQCQREFPILDGVPILLAQIRDQLSPQILGLLIRDDVHPVIGSIFGDCCGPGSELDTLRRNLSHYAVDHWGEFDPDPWPGSGAVVRLLSDVLSITPPSDGGLIVDLGCSIGRSSFELAARTGGLVVGVDLNLSMLRLAARVLRTGRVVYPRRRVGIVYDRRDHAVATPHAEQVDFWACDAAALPFRSNSIDTALSLNVLDCLPDPYGHLKGLATMLRPGGRAYMATPYDWSAHATHLGGWIGGHSQRGADGGDPVQRIRALLTPEHTGLELLAEKDDLPWEVRPYRRSRTLYSCHGVVVQA
jgi:SAM-dependent methyltransferase